MKKILTIITLIFTSNCFAVTGNDLHAWFKSNNDYENGSASYFVIGVSDAMGSYRTTEIRVAKSEKRKPKLSYNFCPPEKITNGQILDIVKKYLDDNPQERHHEGQLLVLNALQVWSCDDYTVIGYTDMDGNELPFDIEQSTRKLNSKKAPAKQK